MIDVEDIIEKFEDNVLRRINKENVMKIINFLKEKKCSFIDELLNNYLDLFIFDYSEFVEKFNKLDKKYNNNLLSKIENDMNILEEFYNI